MKKIYLAGLIVIVCIAAAYLSFGRTKNQGSPPAVKSGEAAVSQPSGGEGAVKPGQEAAGKDMPPGEGEAVEIPAPKQQMIGVRIVSAKVRPLKKTFRTVGRVEFDERKLTTVNIKVEGWIEKLYADYTGKYVKKGTPLAEIYSPELFSVQLEYLNLLKWKNEQSHRFQRNLEFSWGDRYGTTGKLLTFDLEALVLVAKQKFSLWGISDERIREIEEKGTPMRTLTVRSPASGYVFQKPGFRGTRVAPGDKIFDIVDLSQVWVIADIYEYEMPFVKVGQEAKITLSYYPEKEFLSKVDFIYPSLSGQTRTLRARFVIPNPGDFLKPQMFANVDMQIDLGERLAIPETAVLDTGVRQIVYVDKGDGYFAPRQVKLGVRADGVVEVLSGVKAGEKVAASSVFLIDSEAKLKGVTQ